MLDTLLSQLGEGQRASTDAPVSPGERLRAAVDHFFQFVQQHPNYPRLVQREADQAGTESGLDRVQILPSAE